MRSKKCIAPDHDTIFSIGNSYEVITVMTIVVKSSDEDTISLPDKLLTRLRLQEGDEVKAVLEGGTLRLSKLEDFLSLRGVLADDVGFDKALDILDQAWRSWPTPASA
jgi:hypothetical protein